MKIIKIEKDHRPCAVIENGMTVITDTQSALDLLMSAKYEAGAKNIDIGKRLVCKDFFILSTRLVREILQKYVDYGGRISIYEDYLHYTSKPLKDFIYESNSGKDIILCLDKRGGNRRADTVIAILPAARKNICIRLTERPAVQCFFLSDSKAEDQSLHCCIFPGRYLLRHDWQRRISSLPVV